MGYCLSILAHRRFGMGFVARRCGIDLRWVLEAYGYSLLASPDGPSASRRHEIMAAPFTSCLPALFCRE